MFFEGQRRLLLVGALVAVLCAALAVPAGAISPEEARLDATQDKLSQVRSELDAAQDEQSQNAASFAKAERQLTIAMEALNAAEAAVDRQQQAVDRAAQKLADLERAERQAREHDSSRTAAS